MPDAEKVLNNYVLTDYVNGQINANEHGRHRKLFFKAGNFYQGKERMGRTAFIWSQLIPNKGSQTSN